MSIRNFVTWSIPFAWLLAGWLVLSLGPGCIIHIPNPVPTPVPTPTPTPVPPPPPPPPPPPVPHDPVCQPATNCDCWVQPPGQDWSYLTCTAPNTCENHVCTAPTPPPPPPPGPSAQCVDEANLVADTCPVQELGAAVAWAISKVGAPKPTPQASIKAVTDMLNSGGFCAAGGQEAVFVMRGDGRFEEYHVVSFGPPYSWTNSGKGKYMGCHHDSTRVEGVCGSPAPPTNPAHYLFKVKPYSKFYDITKTVFNECEYCRLTGMGWSAPGTLRCTCPMRGDGNVERTACEGAPEWQTDPPGIEIVCNHGNPWQCTSVTPAKIRVCSAGACSDWF